MWKSLVYDYGLLKMLFFNFSVFIFLNFRWLFSKILWKNLAVVEWISRDLMKFYNVTNIFDLLTFDNETTALSKKFEISTEMHFVSSFSLNERNITTSLVIIHLKCAVARYANLNSSSINMPYLRAVEYAI